ncbi:DJ-1/PfpI family protein [Actinosynnema sp. NPDC020468]|uniref:DJ-1/PfpI family protein n=1 Tax=Actinosynnema sp. NPDC020468 TaxID=3154488 RepID=UPI0033CC5CFA
MKNAQVVLFDGFDPLDVVAPYEVLFAGGVDVELVSAEGPRVVPGGSGPLSLRATGFLRPEGDVVVVPGASARDVEGITAALAATLRTPLPRLLGQARDNGAVLATVCGGALVLAMAGLLEGRTAVTHHEGMDFLDATGVTAVDARVVDDGNVVSGGAVTSGLDVALHLLDRFRGCAVAREVERLFAYERRGIVWRTT